MKKYLSYLKMRFIGSLQYRAAALAGIITQLIWGVMLILMFDAFYRAAPESFPMEFSQLSSYIWLGQAFFSMFVLWSFDNDIFDSISSGNIAYELSRPLDIYGLWFVKNMAMRMANATLRSIPMLILASLLPYPFGLSLPESPLHFLIFILSFVLAFLLVVALLMIVYISAFFTVSPMGTKIIVTTVGDFFAGVVIPIPFFPEWLQPVFYSLPFAYMQSSPFLIYSGQMSLDKALLCLLGQIVWIAVLVMIGKLMLIKALKRVVVQGG